MPNNSKVRRVVLNEAHKSDFTIHDFSSEMYQDLKKNLWWPDMKKDITEFVARCVVY